MWSLDLYLFECLYSIAMATKSGTASLDESFGSLTVRYVTQSLCLNKKRSIHLQKKAPNLNLRETKGEKYEKKCRGQQATQEERGMKRTEFDCQALYGLIESKDDSRDRLLHKHRAAGSL